MWKCGLPFSLSMMRVTLRRLQPGEHDPERVLGVLAGSLVLVAAVVATRLPESMIPACRLMAHTGIPCPTCGTYRALRAIASGRFLDAWCMQPAMVAALGVTVAYVAYAWVVVLFHLPRVRIMGVSRRGRLVVLALVLGSFALNWAYLWLRSAV